jgi:hypothetical protein
MVLDILGSLWVSNLTTLSLCRSKINAANTATGILYAGLINQVKIGDKLTVTIAAKDEYRVNNIITNQVIIKNAAKSKPKGSIAPNAVATALPPENSKNSGNICPKQADTATNAK